jgi:hypothetical protein
VRLKVHSLAIFRKNKGVTGEHPKSSKFYVIVNKQIIEFSMAQAQETRGEKMKASLAMLLKTNGGKMSVSSSLAMFMKRHGLFSVSRDIDENKGESR